MKKNIVAFRYFFLKEDTSLFYDPLQDSERMDLLRNRVLKGNEYCFGMSQFALRIGNEIHNIVYGKISKRKTTEVGVKTDEDIQDTKIDDWEYSYFAWSLDPTKQIIFIDYSYQVFYAIEYACKILSAICQIHLSDSGYRVEFSPINEKALFWSSIDKAEKIYAVVFRLKAPNIFGSSIEANKALKEIQQAIHYSHIQIGLQNDKGSLELPEDRIDTYRDYADKGGGSWKLSLRVRGKKIKVDSSRTALTMKIETDDNTDLSIDIGKIFDFFSSHL